MSASTPMMTTGGMTRKLRAARALPQDDLAATSGLGVATIYRAERGQSASADTLASIAAALNVEASALTRGEIEEVRPYVPLEPATSGRGLVAVLQGAERLDFDWVELAPLDQATDVEALQGFCTRMIEEGPAATPISRPSRDLEAKAMLARLAGSGFEVSAPGTEAGRQGLTALWP